MSTAKVSSFHAKGGPVDKPPLFKQELRPESTSAVGRSSTLCDHSSTDETQVAEEQGKVSHGPPPLEQEVVPVKIRQAGPVQGHPPPGNAYAREDAAKASSSGPSQR